MEKENGVKAMLLILISMLVNIEMTRKMVMECLSGKVEIFMKEIIWMTKDMVKVK